MKLARLALGTLDFWGLQGPARGELQFPWYFCCSIRGYCNATAPSCIKNANAPNHKFFFYKLTKLFWHSKWEPICKVTSWEEHSALCFQTLWMLCKLYFVHYVQLNINTCSFWLFPVLYKTGHCERISLQCCTNTEEKATLNKTGPNECLPEGQLCRGYSCR